MGKLLTRDEFRRAVFERDGHLCVVCREPGQDAHHIIERRLWPDGGYYLSNGATVCGPCHLKCESTEISPEDLWEAIGATPLLPPHLYVDQQYDKWGNPVMPNGRRLMGELFFDESVQKVISNFLYLFNKHVKYPRTYHVPWSTLGKDDKMLEDLSQFSGKDPEIKVVCTLKMDGENCTFYNDHIHARSVNSGPHPTRDWVKGLWSRVGYLLDDDMRVCGENLYAQHTVKYEALPSYFMMFSMWKGSTCLSWDETVEYAGILGLATVPVIYRGPFDQAAIEAAFAPYAATNEGYVIRVEREFQMSEFRRVVAKFVRPEFRQELNSAHGHWISKKIEANGLAETK